MSRPQILLIHGAFHGPLAQPVEVAQLIAEVAESQF